MAAFARVLPPVPAEGNRGRNDLLSEKPIYERKGDDYETQHHRKDFRNRRGRRTRSGPGALGDGRGQNML